MSGLICTSNTQSHVDYGIPIVATKSTDYRTSTGSYHRFIPNIPQHYDCRVEANVKPELKAIDVTIRDDRKSVYGKSYVPLLHETNPLEKNHDRADVLKQVHHVRNVQEKMFEAAPPPIAFKLSEMKDSYRMNYYMFRDRETSAPSLQGKCEIVGLGRPLQPGIPPGDPGEWKYSDIYMTVNRLQYPPYSKEQIEKAREDIPTFYSTSGQYKEIRKPLPSPLTGNKSVYDKTFFKHQLPVRCFSRAQKNVPNMKFRTESKDEYACQTYSDFYPYIHSNGVCFEDSLAGAGPWQNLCPPGMYCTEYCHTGTGWPVRAVVDIGPKEQISPHNMSNEKKT